VSDELATFLGLGAIVALFFFTPRKVRGYPAHPAGSGTRAVGACLLMALAFAMVTGIVCRELTAPSR
jgi:hypothetical protein